MSIFGKKSEETEQNTDTEATKSEKNKSLAEAMQNKEMQGRVNEVISNLMKPKEHEDVKESSKQIDPNKTADSTEIPSEENEGSAQIQH